MSAHALFAPSAAYRWLECPGSVKASEGIPETTSIYAEEGTAAHEAAASIIKGELGFHDAMTKFDVPDDLEFVVEEYVNELERISNIITERDPKALFIIEQRMHAPGLDKDFFGTGDFICVSEGVFRLRDLKTGIMSVEVRNSKTGKLNPQLGSYLLLALAHLGAVLGPWDFDLSPTGIERLNIGIIQPRVFDRPQITDVSFDELLEFKDLILWGIKRVRDGDQTRNPGSWCGFCPAKGACPALRKSAVEKAKIIFGDDARPVGNYGPDEMSAIAKEAELIRAHLNGVEAKIQAFLEKGRKVDGFKLVPRRAIRKYLNEDYTQKQLRGQGVTDDHIFKRKMIGPSAMEKMLKVLKINFDLRKHYEPVSSGNTVAPESDPREAIIINPGDAFK